MQQKNLFLFVVLTALVLLGWTALSRYLAPPKPDEPIAKTDESEKPKGDDKQKPDEKGDKKPDEKKDGKKAIRPEVADLQQFTPTPLERPALPLLAVSTVGLLAAPQSGGPFVAASALYPEIPKKIWTLGEQARGSRYHLFVQIDPHAAGVRSLLFNKFQTADPQGQPKWIERDGKKDPVPLELIPRSLNRRSPSFQLYAFDVNDSRDDKQPLDTLGRIDWVFGEKKEETLGDGRRRESLSLWAETQGVRVTKTYTLTEGEYHLGLRVAMRRTEGADKSIKFRYQMTGAHGLPVEGKWYTSIFRNALIAHVDKDGRVYRDLQTLQEISRWAGGNEVHRGENTALVYAGVSNQYFASVIVVDDPQNQKPFLRQARPTLENTLTKGVIVREDDSSFDLKLENGSEETFYVAKEQRPFLDLHKGRRVAVEHHTGSYGDKTEYPEIATAVFDEEKAPPALWVEDLTVRVSTEPVELKGAEEVEHKYLLYNGPVKVSQLFPPPGLSPKKLEEGGVSPELQTRYHDELHLNTLTDYHTPGAMGTFASKIFWTDLVIWCTNLMHKVLGYLHAVIPSYGLCIIVLTVLVRGLMFPLSRKQALMSLRMQQLAPELKKLQEKHKDDRQALGMAQMELYRKHGVNPFGSCWVLLLQMPIFMGLYFALQESIHFRLAEFWPTWITNLAAPDMLFSWSQRIPFISRVEDYGSMLYLGPYFNLLPVIAVALMIVQQSMMTPPPTDEQQAMQQKMMKGMMVFFGLMFYKVAAGLCLYFIASSVWGFCERKLLPKKKLEVGEAPPTGEGYFHKLLRRTQGEQVTTAPATAISTVGGGKRGRNKRRQGQDTIADDTSLLGRWRKRMREWWIAVLKEAEKKNRG
jgi:YidC/Oxa1 family membrane protein insertase